MSEHHTHLRFATDILRHLGEELNPGPDRSIIELVKNAYDADASRCVVTLGSNRTGSFAIIEDDGIGMTIDEIVNGWLVVGRSSKNTRLLTPKGRHQSGSKGLGRLAALRLGTRAELTTRPERELGVEHVLELDWDAFGPANVVEEVGLLVVTRASDKPPGTRIAVTGIPDRVGRMPVKRLARSMLLLADPFGDTPGGFEPVLAAPEYRDLERLVERRYFDSADFHLEAKLLDGRSAAVVRDWRGKVLYEAGHAEVRSGSATSYTGPDCQFDLWAFILSQTNFAQKGVALTEVQNWLGEFGGVHIYLNGLRVEPYGGPGNDWLDMNLLRTRDPQLRPSTNTSIGRVQISDPGEALAQKTDRSGFIESESFESLRVFARDALEWMAKRRIAERDARRATQREKTKTSAEQSRDNVSAKIEALPPSSRTELRGAFEQYDRRRESEANALRQEVQLYRTLSTAGITAATFAHEAQGNPLKVLQQSVDAVERRGKKQLGAESFERHFATPVGLLRQAVRSLAVLGSATLQLLDFEKRRPSKIELNEVVTHMFDTYRPFLDDRGVEIQLELSGGQPYLHGSEATVESIVSNLLTNSLNAFDGSGTEMRRIRVVTDVVGSTWRLEHSDSGPGIKDIAVKDIWLPGETTRPNGTGLGLTIIRDTVADLGGHVSATESGDMGGAVFTVELPLIGA